MIFDKIENLDRYREFAEYGKLIRDFIKQDKSEYLAEGRYELDGENLFALVQTYETVDEIAAKCGYSNGNYFAKAFRENQKMSPTDYRKRMEKRYETEGTT